MNPALRLRGLDVLHNLAFRMGGEPVSGLLLEAVEGLQEVTSARACAAVGVESPLEVVAERGLHARAGSDAKALRQALGALAGRAASTRHSVFIEDLRRDHEGIDDSGEIIALGAHCVFAVPLLHRHTPVGVLVLLFDDATKLDDETRRFIATVARLLALFSEPARKSPLEQASADEIDEAGRMASLGLLTATVAHELRGPAGALVLQQEELARLVEQALEVSDSHDALLRPLLGELSEVTLDIKTAIQRVRDTIEQLSTASRREPAFECVDLSNVVRESLTVATPHLERRGVRLTAQYEPSCLCMGRPYSLGQVALNLVFNALDACAEVAHPEIWVHVTAGPNEVVLGVDDNGPGVTDADVQHIFKPFYTTKRPGHGTGLGLKICSDVVASHGGHIEVHARAGGGASFRVVLSRVRDESRISAVTLTQTPRSRLPAEARKVFLIDDDPVFSRTMRRSLKPHEVRTAASASEAEVLLLDPAYLPDLVLCDVFLPGQNGHKLHARIAERRPEVANRFVFVTGGALGKTEAEYLKASACATLFKPVELKTLVELLEGSPGDTPMRREVRTLRPPPSTPVSATGTGSGSGIVLSPGKSPVPR